MNFNPGSTINSPGAFKGTILTVSALATRDYAGTAAVIQTIYHRNIVRTDIGYDLLTGAQLDSPMWIIVSTSNGAWHHRGRLPDCVMGYENNNAQCAPNGDAVNPGTGIIAVQFGVMLLPFTVVPDLT
jgi:phage tail protein X